MNKHILFKVAALALLPGSGPALANPDYPSRQIALVVPFAAGGGVDLMARYYSKKLSDALGQTVIVENRGGAGGTIGSAHVARAPADGHTLLFTSVAHAINSSYYPKLPFDSLKDFAPITLVARAPNGIAANPGLPFNTLGELLAYAKKNPDKLTYGAISGSTTMYLGMAMLEKAAGVELQYIPYKGTPASVQAAMSGEVDLVSSGYASSDMFAQAGKLKMLAVSSAQATALAPGVPTIAEAANLPGFEVMNWMAVLAPAGTPPAVVDRLNAEIKRIQAEPETVAFYEAQKNEIAHQSPDAFRQTLADEIKRYEKIVRELNIGAEQAGQ